VHCGRIIFHGSVAAGQSPHDDRREKTMANITGTIKRIVSDKGFGFVQAGDGAEYFFHQSACADTRFDDLREGQPVTFDKGQGPKGPRAENIRVA
jgi:CspA family cold shock protein